MPYLKINSCKDCPHHTIEREHWMDDCFRIFCKHEGQTNTEGYVTKISREGSIYFNCPLDNPKHFHCSSCGWQGTKEETFPYEWGDDISYYCPKCNEEL